MRTLRRPESRARASRARAVLAAQVVAVGLAACSSPQNVLDPRGPAAARVEELWWVLLTMGVVVSVVVSILLFVAIRRSRQRQQGKDTGEINGNALVWIGAGVLTPIVIFSLLVYSYRVGVEVYPPVTAEGDALTVEVVGHQFWWEVRYPQYDLLSANEVYIPVGRRIRFLVRSDDVIHSFWVPQLQGKIDMVPGHTNRIWIQADEPGRFRGQCAEYCGDSHALMALWVVAVEEEEFRTWLERRREPGAEPDDEEVQRGREVFFAADCALCHGTRGAPLAPEMAGAGPDLTHLASRSTLAAGTLPNTRGSLAGWISDPQRIKPGSRMPPTRLPPDQLEDLLTYLESLR